MEKTINKDSFIQENPLRSKTLKGLYYAIAFSVFLHLSLFIPHFLNLNKEDKNNFIPVTETVEISFLQTINTVKVGESKKSVIVKEKQPIVQKKETFIAETVEPIEEENFLDEILSETFAKKSVNVNTTVNEELAAYKKQIQEKILKEKFYPIRAKKRGYEGTVGVKFTLNKDGNITDIAVIRPCHINSLNEAALKTVKDAAPFTSIPRDFDNDTISMELDIAYDLN